MRGSRKFCHRGLKFDKFFFVVFLVVRGGGGGGGKLEDQNTALIGPSSAKPAKHH